MSNLVDLVNLQCSKGVFESIVGMLSILQGNVDAPLDLRALHRTVHSTTIYFMWMRVSQLMEDPDPDAYAVLVFTAQGSRNNQPQLLAYIFSRFHELKSAGWGTARLTMIELYYQFTSTSLHGLMVYDGGLDGWYRGVRASDNVEGEYRASHKGIPVTVWNAGAHDFSEDTMHPQMERCMKIIRELV